MRARTARPWRERLARAPWLTLAIAAAVVASGRAKDSLTGFGPSVSELASGAAAGYALREGELWRLVSASFVHADAEHLRNNLIGLLVAGPLLELTLRRSTLLVALLASSIASFSLVAVASHECVLARGLSAVVIAFAGAYLGLWLRR